MRLCFKRFFYFNIEVYYFRYTTTGKKIKVYGSERNELSFKTH